MEAGIEPQRLVVMSRRLLVSSLGLEGDAQVVVCQIARVCPMGESIGPQAFRVEPGPALVPRQGGQPQEHSEASRDHPDGGGRTPARRHPPEPAETGGRHHHAAQHSHVSIAIRGKLLVDPNDARVRRQDHQVTRPGRQQPRPAPAQRNKPAEIASVARMLKLNGNASQFCSLGAG